MIIYLVGLHRNMGGLVDETLTRPECEISTLSSYEYFHGRDLDKGMALILHMIKQRRGKQRAKAEKEECS